MQQADGAKVQDLDELAAEEMKLRTRVPETAQFSYTKEASDCEVHVRTAKTKAIGVLAAHLDDDNSTVHERGVEVERLLATISVATEGIFGGYTLHLNDRLTLTYLKEQDGHRVGHQRMQSVYARVESMEKQENALSKEDRLQKQVDELTAKVQSHKDSGMQELKNLYEQQLALLKKDGGSQQSPPPKHPPPTWETKGGGKKGGKPKGSEQAAASSGGKQHESGKSQKSGGSKGKGKSKGARGKRGGGGKWSNAWNSDWRSW